MTQRPSEQPSLSHLEPILMPDGLAEQALIRALASLSDEVSGFNRPLVGRIVDEEGRYSEERTRAFVEDLLAGGDFSSESERDFYRAFFYCEIRMHTTDWVATENYLEGLDPWIPDPTTATLMDVVEDALRAKQPAGIPNFCVRDCDYLRQLYVALGGESAYQSLAELITPSGNVGSHTADMNTAYEQQDAQTQSMSDEELIAAGITDPDAAALEERYRAVTSDEVAGTDANDDILPGKDTDAPWDHPEQIDYVANLRALHERQRETLRYTMPDCGHYLHQYRVFERLLPKLLDATRIESHVLDMAMDYLRRNPTPIRQNAEELLGLVREIEALTARLRKTGA